MIARRHVLRLLGGGVVSGLLTTPARADAALDVAILQTASSLEALAAAAHARAGAGPLAGFAEAAARRHTVQKEAFQARTTALGGRIQDAPNPQFLPLLAGDPAAIEKVAVDTYLTNLAALQDVPAKDLVAGALAVAAQHLAVLRVAGANPALVRIPFRPADLAKLPHTAASVATPDALHQRGGPDSIAEPASGAVG